MPLELGVWRIDAGLQRLPAEALDLESRLEGILDSEITIASPDWLVIGRQVATPYGKLIDLLAIDSQGNLIVVELKRDRTEREIVAQLLDYGSWVRGLRGDDIGPIFNAYRRKYRPTDSDESIDAVFCRRFNARSMPDEINSSHELVIVGTSFDPSTERIVRYLSEEYGVRINAVFFRVFKDDEREYLTRAWLQDPVETDVAVSPLKGSHGSVEWNGEYYASFGDGMGRSWEDAQKYSFFSAGGGTWYTKTLNMLSPGDRIWVNIPGPTGYVGVGIVEEPSVPVSEFKVTGSDGNQTPILNMPLTDPSLGRHVDDPERIECVVRVKWLKTLPKNRAIYELGFFGNQNTVARPRDPKWNYTVERLKERFGIQ